MSFGGADQSFELSAILEHLAGMPQLGLGYSTEARDRLPLVAGGIALALARSIAVIEPTAARPRSADLERAFRLFDLLL